MKTCETCGADMPKPPKQGYAYYETMRFCRRQCVRPTQKPDNALSPATRYRVTKVGGTKQLKHRAVMEQILGRPLLRTEIVHHKNHNKLDNRPENLELMTAKEHSTHHNQRHPLTKACVICGTVFTPHPTKRARQQTCSDPCKRSLMSKRNADYQARRAS